MIKGFIPITHSSIIGVDYLPTKYMIINVTAHFVAPDSAWLSAGALVTTHLVIFQSLFDNTVSLNIFLSNYIVWNIQTFPARSSIPKAHFTNME